MWYGGSGGDEVWYGDDEVWYGGSGCDEVWYGGSGVDEIWYKLRIKINLKTVYFQLPCFLSFPLSIYTSKDCLKRIRSDLFSTKVLVMFNV